MATPIIGITEIEQSSNSKFIQHNQALEQLEVYAIASILGISDAPIATPATGDLYLIGVSATGVWAGQDNNLTVYNGTGWSFYPAVSGISVRDSSTGRVLSYDGVATEWVVSGGARQPSYSTATQLALSNYSSFLQVVNPSGTASEVILPDPPLTQSDFAIVNDSDNLSANGNTLSILDSIGGTTLQVLDDTTGKSSVNATWIDSESKWLIWG